MSTSCCAGGLEKSNNWFGPEFVIHKTKCVGEFYKTHPVMSRLIAVPLVALTGTVKVVGFPFIALVGMVVFPIMAIIRASQGRREEAVQNLQACGFCALAIVGTVAFLGLFAFNMPLVWSLALIAAGVAISIIIHVYKIAKEPSEIPFPTSK